MEEKNIVFWGAGKLGREFYSKYSDRIAKPVYWIDGNISLQHTKLLGIEIISPMEFFTYVKNGYFSSNLELIITARSVGALEITAMCFRNNFSYPIKYAFSLYGKYYFQENNSKVNEVKKMFHDDESREVFDHLINNITNGRLTDTSLWHEQQYFPNSIINNFEDGDVIIDVGVCDGEEIDRALALNENIFIHAFEPNKKSYNKLKLKYANCNNINLLPYALWDKNTNVIGAGSNPQNISFIEFNSCGHEINAIKLDDVIKDKVDYIKMDIEGAESRALLGAKDTIMKYKPNLLISLYHNIEDYIEIPLLIKNWYPDYKFYLRHHSPIDSESVFYAIRY